VKLPSDRRNAVAAAPLLSCSLATYCGREPATEFVTAHMRRSQQAICSAMAVLSGCVSANEVSRASTPDGYVDAVLIERNGGATTAFDYRVYLAAANGSASSGVLVAALYGAARSDSAYGVRLRWSSADTLRIEYLDAKDTSHVGTSP
jgi:hypothetical protein